MMEALGVIQFWAFFVGVVVIILLPGPNSLYVLKTSVTHGKVKAWQAVFAVLLGDAILILLAYLGVVSLLQASPEIFNGLRYAGAAYLLYLGISILRASFQNADQVQVSEQSNETDNVFVKSLLLSLTNPKAILFYLSFFVQFIDYSFAPSWLPYLVLATTLELVSFVYLAFLVYIGATISHFFANKKGWAKVANVFLGILFSGFALHLALS